MPGRFINRQYFSFYFIDFFRSICIFERLVEYFPTSLKDILLIKRKRELLLSRPLYKAKEKYQ